MNSRYNLRKCLNVQEIHLTSSFRFQWLIEQLNLRFLKHREKTSTLQNSLPISGAKFLWINHRVFETIRVIAALSYYRKRYLTMYLD